MANYQPRNNYQKKPNQPQQQQAPVKDISLTLRHLNNMFNAVTNGLEKANNHPKTGPNLTYQIQSEFAYRINEVMIGPRCLLPKNIAECNEYIDEVIQLLNK